MIYGPENTCVFVCPGNVIYFQTKLKLDKEVGGGDLSELCTVTYLIAYPYA